MDPGQQQQRRILTPEDVKLAIEASRRLEYAISDENVARRSSLPSSSLDSFHVMSLPTLRIRRSSDDATAPLGTGSVASAQNTQQRRSMLRLGSPFGQRPLRASAPVLGSGNGVYHRADVQRAIRATHRRGDSNVRDPNGEQAQAGENRTGKTVMEVLADRGLLFADVAKTAVPDSSQGDSSGEQPQLHASEPTPSHEDSQAPSTTHQPTAFTTPPPHYRHPGLQTMGIVRAYCMSRTAGPGENVEHLTPIRDDSDSCDSLLSDTPTFPNDVQESLPSLTEERQEDMSSTPGDTIIQAPRQEHAPKTTDDTLQSDSAISDEAGLLSKTAELSLTTNTALTAEISGTSPTSALPQIKDATDSLIARLMMQSPPSPPPPPRSQNPINGNGQPALLRKTENDLPPRPEVSAVNSNHSFMFPGPGAPGKKSGKAGKKGNKGHGHAKTGSLNSIKHNDNGNSRNRSFQSQSQSENGANAFRSTLVQEERYIRRTPSPPPIVKLSVRDKKLLWPIGPFIPWNVWGCPPWEMDSTNFVNVLCTNVGILRLPFSIPFLRLLRSMLKSNHGDHVITFPTMLANAENMAPYWERCYYAQQFLWKNARYFNWKPFEELPQSEWPKVEILLGSDNLKDSKWDVYLRQTDEKRLLFRCVEQKLGEDDKEPKATFFVTVHQTGVNQVQYSDPTTRDPDIPLPPLDGSPDPRILPEYQYTLPNYLCLNESRGLNTHGFVDIGVPAKRLNFHPFGPRNFDQLWYGMAHLQELVCADDNKSLGTLRPDQDPDTVFGKGKAEELKERTTTMMGHGGPKFLTHEEILVMNFHVPSEE
ncbi:hypothetical protein Dda_3283 [Drechslerella dactyloides]|uniref:Uncharacterized protein n=1 Tax=Drechslerella dactyloides TaxID=74499 RepID=A0AAD6J1C0_DREDA|nr:hypothetical protein Dda_3283 [Drechslerella dactyloides]